MNLHNLFRRRCGLVAVAGACLGLVTLAQAGPVAYWTFDNTVNDAVGSSHGALNGGAGYSGTVPAGLPHSTASLELNAGDPNTDWFSAPVGVGVQGSYTISAWTQMRDNTGNRNFFDTRSGGNTFDVKFGTSPISGNPSIHGDIGNGAGWINTGADADIAAGTDTWYHVAYVVDQWSYQIYVDGTQLTPVATGTYTANSPLLFPGTSEVNIGRHVGGNEYFNGYIDDVAVWDTTLSADAIAQLAAGTVPTAIADTRTSNSTGALKYLPINGDADSDISAAKTYSHKLDFGTSPVAAVNGVTFDQGQNGDFPTYACDIPNPHGGNGAHGVPGTEGIADLFQDMNYNNSNATVLLKGLSVGQAYDARLYMRSWDGAYDRTQTITFDVDSDGAADKTIRVNEDDARKGGNVYVPGFDVTQPYALSYNFVAESEEMAIGIKQRGGGSFHIYGLTNEETDRVPIDSLFSTGLGDDGVALLGGVADPHYVLVAGPQGDPGEPALAVTSHSAWAFNDDGSRFISVANPGTTNIAAGTYTYETTFDLTGLLPETAEILMTVFADNELTDVRLNGVSTGITMVDDPDHLLQFFTHENSGTFLLESGFQPGINTLEFDLYNLPTGQVDPSPGALRVELSGSAAVPEPSTWVLLLSALGGALLAIRRRKSSA